MVTILNRTVVQFLKYLLQYNSLYYFDPPCILPLLMYAKLQSSDGASELPTLFSPMYIIYCHLPDREFLILRLWRFFLSMLSLVLCMTNWIILEYSLNTRLPSRSRYIFYAGQYIFSSNIL